MRGRSMSVPATRMIWCVARQKGSESARITPSVEPKWWTIRPGETAAARATALKEPAAAPSRAKSSIAASRMRALVVRSDSRAAVAMAIRTANRLYNCSVVGALAAAPYDDVVLLRTIRRIGLLDRTEVFDQLAAHPPAPPGPPRQENAEPLVRRVRQRRECLVA